MKTLRILFLLLAALLPLRADDTVSFDYFYDSLLPYGEWCEVDGYGYVWHPTGVDEEWAPYTDGYWAYTDAGWTWVSYEDWGAITYHYGRWTEIDDYGWCWVPDYEWGPAWVAWRKSEDYVGWAPLPPEARWERDTGISTWVDVSYDIGPTYYNFCRWNDFGAPVIRSVILPRWNSVTIIESTINITNITYNTDYGCVYNGGFDYGYVLPRVYRPLPTLILVQNTTNVFINGNNNNVYINARRGNTLVVSTPRQVANNPNTFTRRPVNVRKLEATRVNRGWRGIKDPAVRDRLQVKLRDETKGADPKTAPAKPFKSEQVAVVPKIADPNAKVEDAPLGHPQRPQSENKKQNVATQPPDNTVVQPAESEGRKQKGDKGDKDKSGQPAAVVPQPANDVVDERKPNRQPAQVEVMPGEDETRGPGKERKQRDNLVAPRDRRNEKEPKPQRGTVTSGSENVVQDPVESRPPVNQPSQVIPDNQNRRQEQRQAEAEQKQMREQQKQVEKQQEAAEAAQRRQEKSAQENAQRQQQQEIARQQQEAMRKQQQDAAREQRKQQQDAARQQQQETAREQQRQQQQEAARQQQNAAREQQRQQQQEAARQQQQAERAAAQAEARQRQQQEAQQQRAAQQAEARERAQAAAENARRSQEIQQRQAAQAEAAQRAAQQRQQRQQQPQQMPPSDRRRSGKDKEEEQ